MSNPRRPSEDLELHEISRSKAKKFRDQSVPLLDTEPDQAPPRPRRPNAANFSFFRRYLYGRNLILYICLGILFLCMIVLVLYFVFAGGNESHYKVSTTYIAPNQNLYSATLEWGGGTPEHEIEYITENRIQSLNLSIQCYTPTQLRFTIRDTEHKRWEIPEQDPYPYVKDPVPCNYNQSDIEFSIQEDPFTIRIWRKSTQEVLIDMTSPLVFAENYMEFTTAIPSYDFYGLGERLYKFQMGAGTYTIWPIDQFGNIESGEPGHNLYGQQPMYLMREASGNYHIVLLRNSNAMEVTIGKDKTLKYQVIGGIFDFQIFLGSKDPETLVETYHDYLGNWLLPPFWSMGFQQSKWGYKDINDFSNVLKNYSDYNIPLDVIWSDIDYMIQYIGFTINKTNFPIEELKATLAQYDKKWVPIMDAGIGVVDIPDNTAYAKGLARGVFLKDKTGNPLLGTVWPGTSVFPDFFHPEADDYWAEMLEDMYTEIPYDGVWLDMNEVSNFCEADCVKNISSYYDTLFFRPGNKSLQYKTLNLDAVHYGGVLEFDAHSLFNILESKVTYEYMKTKTPLPFVLTRANIFGSGKYASHWFGDTRSDWISMRYTVASLFNYNLFGIPHVGADICGFLDDTTPELCTRWTQLGAFYPFARNHHVLESIRQEPFQFEDPYKTAMIDAIRFRYSILKHFYTLFVTKSGKGTVVRPLFFEFPNDPKLFGQSVYVEEQLMIGKSIMVAPVLHQQQTQTQVYFPTGSWYSLLTYEAVTGLDASRSLTVNTPLESMIPTYIRGGWIVMVQDSSTVMSTKDLTNDFIMVVALNESTPLKATGEILDVPDYVESTIFEQCVNNDCILQLTAQVSWNVATSKLTITVEANRRTAVEVSAGNVVVKEMRVLGKTLKDIDVSQLGEVTLRDGNNAESASTVMTVSKEGDSLALRSEEGIILSNKSKFIIEN